MCLALTTCTLPVPMSPFGHSFLFRSTFPSYFFPLPQLPGMQSARSLCSRHLARSLSAPRVARQCRRLLATDSAAPSGSVPWFVDQEYEQPKRPLSSRQLPPHLKPTPPTAAPVPEDAPEPVKLVHSALSRSPHLDLSTLVAARTVDPPPGPPLPLKAPQGRRKRGSTYGGESMFDVPGGIWSWTVMAQVRGFIQVCGETSIESGVPRSKRGPRIAVLLSL